jgi:hypothetical protein
MRDCMFYVADLNMAEAFKGFLQRDKFQLSLRCGAFEFDALQDLARAKGKTDGGLWRHAGSLLKGYLQTHRRLVVCLDCDFGGSPGQAQIKADITRQLLAVGWQQQNFLVLAIDPELEQWIWQDSIHIEHTLKHQSPPKLRDALAASKHWPVGQNKPTNPKEVLEMLVDQNLQGDRSSSLYAKITSKVSPTRCTDPEFQALRKQLQVWFP